jgi:hypothetical protein
MQFVLPREFGDDEISALVRTNNNVPFIACLLEQADDRKKLAIAAIVPYHMNIDTIKLVLPYIPKEKYVAEMDFLLSKAASVGAVDVTRYLFEIGVSPNGNIPHITSHSVLSNPDILDLFLQYGADVNYRKGGYPPLTCLSNVPHAVTVLRKLLWHGADCNVRQSCGTSVFSFYLPSCDNKTSLAIIVELYHAGAISDESLVGARGIIIWSQYRRLHVVNKAIGGNLILARYLSLVDDKKEEISEMLRYHWCPEDTRTYLLSL